MIRTLLVALSLLVLTPVAHAQTAGVSLTPTILEERADPGQTIASAVELTNLSQETRTYYLFARDIEGVADNGRPIYAEETLERSGQELSSWITLTATEVTLEPEQSQTVQFVITTPEDAAPGGHFGGIFAALEPPRAVGEGASAGVGYQVGNIINLRVSGEIIEQANIRSLQTDRFIFGEKNVTFIATVENEGNVLVRPIGPLTVTNMLGDTVAELTMNEARNGVYPGSQRDLETTWQENGLGFGRYTASVALVYGIAGEAQYNTSANTVFWVLPWEIIQPLLITLVVLALVSYVLVRYYINQQIRKLSGGRRLIRTAGQQPGPSPLVLMAIIMLFVTAFVLFILLMIFA
jgi:hypothetical protein